MIGMHVDLYKVLSTSLSAMHKTTQESAKSWTIMFLLNLIFSLIFILLLAMLRPYFNDHLLLLTARTFGSPSAHQVELCAYYTMHCNCIIEVLTFYHLCTNGCRVPGSLLVRISDIYNSCRTFHSVLHS